MVAMERTGVLESYGLEGEVIGFAAGGPVSEALNGGQLDFGVLGNAPGIILASTDAPVSWVARVVDFRAGLVVTSDSPVQDLSDLIGGTIATFFSADAHHLLLTWLDEAGLVDQIDVVHLSPEDWTPALRRGDIDAWMGWDPLFASALLEDDLRAVQVGTVSAPGLAVMQDSFIAENPDAAVALMAAYIESVVYMSTNKDEVNEWASAEGGLPVEAVANASAADLNYKNATSVGDVQVKLTEEDLDALRDVADYLLALGSISSAPDPSRFWDPSLVDAAMELIETNGPQLVNGS